MRDVKDVFFVVAGDGHERSALERMVVESGLEGKVVFLGDITHTPALIKCLEVGVLLPRSNEGLSNTILEYMAGGIPVVATDCGGNKELIVDGKNGFIVPVGDMESAADRIRVLLQDKQRARDMGEHGRKKVELSHRPESVTRQFKALYSCILGSC